MHRLDRQSLIRTVAFALLMGLIWYVRPATAMTFTAQRVEGSEAVVARGTIEAGDAGRLEQALRSATRDGFGHKILVLESNGGQVGEAFAMVAVMDREQVSTLVRPGATCASACAQILFLSGIHRVVAEGGRLGLHSCHDAKDRARSLACNQMIAQNAMVRGTPYGSILAFMQLTAPAEVRWLDSREADCWGFTQGPPGSGRGVKAGEAAPCLLKGQGTTSIAAAGRHG